MSDFAERALKDFEETSAQMEAFLRVVGTLPTKHIAERRIQRMLAHLDGVFDVHLWSEAYPEAAAWPVTRFYGANIIWH